MSTFTEELRHENYLILKTLSEAKRLTMRTLRGRKIFFDKKDELIAHFKSEDNNIHTVLQGAIQSHPDIQQSLNMFKSDVENTTNVVLEFFKKHKCEDQNKELSDDFDNLCTLINKRIEKEENIFYVEFDEIQAEEELLKKSLL